MHSDDGTLVGLGKEVVEIGEGRKHQGMDQEGSLDIHSRRELIRRAGEFTG